MKPEGKEWEDNDETLDSEVVGYYPVPGIGRLYLWLCRCIRCWAYSLNLAPEDSQEFISRIRAKSSGYTTSNSVVRESGAVTQSSFTANTHNIKYWASEGNEYGEI